MEEFLRFESPLNIATTRIHYRLRSGSARWKYPQTNLSLLPFGQRTMTSDQFDAPERLDHVTENPTRTWLSVTAFTTA